jgi:hypothetical protein
MQSVGCTETVEIERADLRPRASIRRYAWLLALIAVVLLPFCFLGYGPDVDTYGVLEAGRATWAQHQLATSRNPGYWTYEAIVYAAAKAGGYLLINLLTLGICIMIVARVLVILQKLGARFPGLVASILVSAPVFAIAATTTIDYLWSLLGLVLFIEWLAEDRWGWAAAAGTFAYLIRVANCMEIAGIVGGGMLAEVIAHRRLTARSLKILLCAAMAAIIGSLPLIASYQIAGHSFAFVQGMIGDPDMWTMKMRIGRFVLKGMLLLGIPASLLLVSGLLFWRRFSGLQLPEESAFYRERAMPLIGGGVVGAVILFFKYPIETSYLIPGETFLLLLLSVSLLAWRRRFTIALLVTVLGANLVTIQLAQPNIPGKATAARLHFALRDGQMVDCVKQRIRLLHCRTVACWNDPGSPEGTADPLH